MYVRDGIVYFKSMPEKIRVRIALGITLCLVGLLALFNYLLQDALSTPNVGYLYWNNWGILSIFISVILVLILLLLFGIMISLPKGDQ